MQFSQSRGVRSSILAAIMFGICAATGAQALDLKPEEIRGDGDKEKASVSVLQNRFFNKTLRPELGLVVGSVLNDAYIDYTLLGGRIGLFFNEWIGAEVQVLKASSKDSADRSALYQKKYKKANPAPGEENDLVTPDVEVNPIAKMTDFTLVASPFYGKLNLLNLYILYTDVYVTGGLSRVDTDQGMLNAITMSGGQRFYFLDSVSVRLDFRNRSYTEKRLGTDSRKNVLSFEFGLSYFFL